MPNQKQVISSSPLPPELKRKLPSNLEKTPAETPAQQEIPAMVVEYPSDRVPFEFTGNAGEYFRIWIVNIFLTIVTLGIYSAWAKVRKKRYFYGNTLLQGSSFEYLGDPIKILKGRFIVLGLFVAYLIATRILPAVEAISWLLFLAILPWLVMKARTFNARNSSYRSIQFDFRASYREAYKVFFGLAIVAGLTGGLAYPYFAYQRSKFLVSNSRCGATPFEFSGQGRDFYAIYLKTVLFSICLVALIGLIAAVILPQIGPLITPQTPQSPDEWKVLLFKIQLLVSLFVGFLVFLPSFIYLKTKITNLVLSNTVIANNRFESTLDTNRMISLYLSNALAIVISLGLLIPWASIRMTRYRLDNIKLLAAGDLDEFAACQQDKIGAAGEEISDFFDVDVGL